MQRCSSSCPTPTAVPGNWAAAPRRGAEARPLTCTFPHRCTSSKGVQWFLQEQKVRRRLSVSVLGSVLSAFNFYLGKLPFWGTWSLLKDLRKGLREIPL